MQEAPEAEVGASGPLWLESGGRELLQDQGGRKANVQRDQCFGSSPKVQQRQSTSSQSHQRDEHPIANRTGIGRPSAVLAQCVPMKQLEKAAAADADQEDLGIRGEDHVAHAFEVEEVGLYVPGRSSSAPNFMEAHAARRHTVRVRFVNFFMRSCP